MGYTSDFMPHIGEVPNSPGQYVIAGFSGRGMAYIFLASQAVAKMVTRGIDYEQTGLPAIFKSTIERLSSTESELENEFQSSWEAHEERSSEEEGLAATLQAKL